MQRYSLNYGGHKIPYTIIFLARNPQKIAIHVHPDGKVQVDAPLKTPVSDIKQAVLKRARWIWQKRENIRQQKRYLLPKEYISGECLYYMGRRYVLKVRKINKGPATVKLLNGRLTVRSSDTSANTVKTLLQNWYRTRAEIIFQQRLHALSKQLRWLKTTPGWKLRTMKKQWGSCSPKGVLSLNPHLVKAPRQCIDYVLLHELCHLQHHNHSKAYYALLSKELPEWQVIKNRLDGMSELLLY